MMLFSNSQQSQLASIVLLQLFYSLYSLEEPLCPVGQFSCKGTSDAPLCVPQSSNCNGVEDCPKWREPNGGPLRNGSDEENCLDPHLKRVWDSMFEKRWDEDAEKLNDTCRYSFAPEYTLSLSLSDQKSKPLIQLSPIFGGDEDEGARSPGPFSPEKENEQENGDEDRNNLCMCTAEKIFCQNLHLQDLNFIPKEVEFLDLSGSRVERLDFSNSFPALETLILSGCYVEEIGGAAFENLTSLRVLYLTNNRLRYLGERIFSVGPTGSGIRQLSLDYNQISVIQTKSFDGLKSLEELYMRHNQLVGRESNVFTHLASLTRLHLDDNRIESIRRHFLSGLHSLETLSLQRNEISYVEVGAFDGLVALKQLYLNWNKLRSLENGMFCNLRNLLTLNLGGNEIKSMSPHSFSCLHSLNSLTLDKNRLGEITNGKLPFSNLSSLNYIYFDHYWMCSWASHVRSCEPKGDGISSLTNLLDSVILRVCVWIMGILSIVGNLFVIFCRMLIREPNRVHSFFIRNLAGADLLMGVFLLVIAYHDIAYRGVFLAHQSEWRHSTTCKISGMLSTWSSESSVLILSLITLDRYTSIVRPFGEKNHSLHVATGIVLFLWAISLLLSLAPLAGLFPTYFEHFYTSNGLCLPLYTSNPFDPGWEFSFFLFIILNSSAFIFMCFAYARMLQVIKKSTLMIRSTQQKQDSILAKRFSLVVFTDFLCWAPIVGTKLLGMGGVRIPSTLYAWLAVFALPVNSAINPIIYTLTTKLFKQQFRKMTRNFHSRLRRANNNPDESTSLSIVRYKTPKTGNTSVAQSIRGKGGQGGVAAGSAMKTTELRLIVQQPSPSKHTSISFATMGENEIEIQEN